MNHRCKSKVAARSLKEGEGNGDRNLHFNLTTALYDGNSTQITCNLMSRNTYK